MAKIYQCVNCHKVKLKLEGRGLCRSCYDTLKRHNQLDMWHGVTNRDQLIIVDGKSVREFF